MNIKNLSDDALLSQIKIDAAQERKSGLVVIQQLREVARRRLDAKLGYDSLHKYCTEELHYSPGSAWRRINAMRALGDLPELEEKLAAGTVSVATVSQVESFCRREEKSETQKREIFAQIEGLSKRETERVLAEIAPLPERTEKVRVIDGTSTEIRVTLSSDAIAALDHIKDLIAHARPNATYAEAIEYLAKMGLKKLDPQLVSGDLGAGGESASGTGLDRQGTLARKSEGPDLERDSVIEKENGALKTKVATEPLSLAAISREVWRRDGGRCTYVSPGGKKCQARRYVQKDHIIPRAKGGPDTLENFRLRCRSHNLLAAIEEFGVEKMEPYLGGSESWPFLIWPSLSWRSLSWSCLSWS